MSRENILCKHKSFRIFDTALRQIELEKQAAINNLLDNSKNPLAEAATRRTNCCYELEICEATTATKNKVLITLSKVYAKS